MLEYWYKEKRTLVDFRRGPLGPHFDGFAARLKAEDYSSDGAKTVLSKCCQFNAFLIERGIATCGQLTESLIEPFLDVYLVHTRSAGTYYSPRIVARGDLKRLFRYLVETKVWQPPKPARIRKPHDWMLHPYLQHLQDECGFSAVTLQRVRAQVGSFLNAFTDSSSAGTSVAMLGRCIVLKQSALPGQFMP